MMKHSEYLLSKLFASFVLIFVFCLWVKGWDLYGISSLASSKGVLILFIPYALCYSMLIDWACSYIHRRRLIWLIAFYIIGGYLPFFVLTIWNGAFFYYFILSFFAGTIGMICSLAHLALSRWMLSFTKLGRIISILVIGFVLIVMNVDFTQIDMKQEELTETSYTAQFNYFHGEHSIPIRIDKGQTLHLEISWGEQSVGYGYSMKNPKGKPVGLSGDPESGALFFTADQTGVYKVELSGEHFSGSVSVKWKLTEEG